MKAQTPTEGLVAIARLHGVEGRTPLTLDERYGTLLPGLRGADVFAAVGVKHTDDFGLDV